MDIQEIMQLIQGVSDHNLTSFELEEGNVRISLKREKETIQVQTPVLAAAVHVGTMPGAPLAGAVAGAPLTGAVSGTVAPGAVPGVVAGAPLAGAAAPGVLPATAADMTAGVPKDGAGQADGAIDADQVQTSPLVGVFYAASSPDAEPFVKVGDRVKKGQVLGIIEAMKLMNEIESEYDGVVEAILVENEDVVEYGQPLFRIR